MNIKSRIENIEKWFMPKEKPEQLYILEIFEGSDKMLIVPFINSSSNPPEEREISIYSKEALEHIEKKEVEELITLHKEEMKKSKKQSKGHLEVV